MTRLTMREQDEALRMHEVKECKASRIARQRGECFYCNWCAQCPWCLEDW